MRMNTDRCPKLESIGAANRTLRIRDIAAHCHDLCYARAARAVNDRGAVLIEFWVVDVRMRVDQALRPFGFAQGRLSL